ncbi:aldehyde-activating protein [Pseudidiomarina aquimaris]|uniref:Aldehyde-activating protein n=1 Tax=Pseudidiomarina aquimaris TaxID=641841 RepID=A0A432XQN2_9GAMM|nr:GFA family protein [Pseudidiomarina aquimaris]RUO51045.1 aldehyde-activating protein [Pseudidiomarina aquimaris]
MTTHRGSCLCGTVRFEIKGEFDSFFLCHCKHCQKDTGSAHAANLFSQSAKLNWQAGQEAVTSFTLPQSRHSKSFCKHCGSALPNTQNEALLVVPAGCLDTEVKVKPTGHLFTSSRATWEAKLSNAPEYEGLPE